MATSRKAVEATIDIIEVTRGQIELQIVGRTPLICNAMSSKARQELLLPGIKKNAAAKAANAKHQVLSEFRSSMYRARDPGSPTRIVMKSTAFKAAMMGAALDIPGSSKRQIGRLAYVLGDEVPVFGIPQLHMSITRQAGMDRTPDVRTRSIIPRWACRVIVEYTKPILKEGAIVNLLAAAGFSQGIGDWRVEKGSGIYGQFNICQESDLKTWDAIVKEGGKDAQDRAIVDPQPFDSETEELLGWWIDEMNRRGFEIAA
jgi:hypothetical protein